VVRLLASCKVTGQGSAHAVGCLFACTAVSSFHIFIVSPCAFRHHECLAVEVLATREVLSGVLVSETRLMHKPNCVSGAEIQSEAAILCMWNHNAVRKQCSPLTQRLAMWTCQHLVCERIGGASSIRCTTIPGRSYVHVRVTAWPVLTQADHWACTPGPLAPA
jgi:hypothetical protein